MNTYKKYISYLSRWFYGKEDSLSLYEKEDEIIIEMNNDTVHGPMPTTPDEKSNATSNATSSATSNAKNNKTVNRPWGHYTPLYEDNPTSNQVNRIVVLFNKKLSLQSRNKRSKHWIIVKGHAKIQIGNNQYNVGKSIHVYIPINTEHRIENIGGDVLEFIEIQIGEETDIR
jgi:mannose-6-phosphate isomerase-like protein (cupin superfamily)